jgi:four helix bundle protein
MQMAVARFRDSVGWQKAMTLIVEVYAATSGFPKEEMFGLTSQLRRAAVSVASNIAEGQGRLTTGEFVQFLGMARGSTLEVQTQLEAAKMLKFGRCHDLDNADATATEVVLILNAAIATCRSKIAVKTKAKGMDRREHE